MERWRETRQDPDAKAASQQEGKVNGKRNQAASCYDALVYKEEEEE
jgi:hypothetical protein